VTRSVPWNRAASKLCSECDPLGGYSCTCGGPVGRNQWDAGHRHD